MVGDEGEFLNFRQLKMSKYCISGSYMGHLLDL